LLTISRMSKKYRAVSSGFNVDESLFGESQSTRVKSAKARVPVSRPASGSSVGPKATVISEAELRRLKVTIDQFSFA
jgi:hypothetical protein